MLGRPINPGRGTFVANHKSALKRARQSERQYQRNHAVKSSVRTSIKKFHAATASGDVAASEETLKVAECALRKAGSKGVFPLRRVDRLVSRLTLELNKARSAS